MVASSSTEPAREVLAGTIERVTFTTPRTISAGSASGLGRIMTLITIVGHAAAIAAGEWVTATGDWVNDHTHGQQFKARFLRTSAPSFVEGIEKYLASGMIRAVGPPYSKKMPAATSESSPTAIANPLQGVQWPQVVHSSAEVRLGRSNGDVRWGRIQCLPAQRILDPACRREQRRIALWETQHL
jgi:hypothetical protein